MYARTNCILEKLAGIPRIDGRRKKLPRTVDADKWLDIAAAYARACKFEKEMDGLCMYVCFWMAFRKASRACIACTLHLRN